MNIYLAGAKNPETKRQVSAQQQANPHFHLRGFIDNDPAKHGTSFIGVPVVGGVDRAGVIAARDPEARFLNLITGSTRARFDVSRDLAERGCRFINLIHPSVEMSDVEVGLGNYIQDRAIVHGFVRIGHNSSVSTAALVEHECVVGNSVFVGPAAAIAGLVVIDDGVFIGVNATIKPRVHIGAWATIGAGAVVVRDVEAGTTVAGSPARVIGRMQEEVPHTGDIFAE